MDDTSGAAPEGGAAPKAPLAPILTGALDYRDALPGGGALLGLDLGTQTIGTAFCDAGWRFASPGKTIKRGKFGADKATMEALIRERSIKGIVIGLPLNMDGSSGPRAQSSRAYARNLAVLGLPILLWDERWSTSGAERSLIAQDMSRAKRSERIDSAAAAVILQGAIDALAGGCSEGWKWP
ncbi:Holliday junction resolvase RuvX [Novosphingobium sp. 9]|uniref:Holliday junction resolvase RuvX n=1 Tax=Novosphingobium sp. 9 TaxID=2025349 RepID=UPI0021B5558F|nr:Holliday junction resolvase RuvX [Novosphingobium sp. 9]